MTTALAAADTPWSRAMIVAALFAIDPVGLTGVSIRAGNGPVRDRWLARLRHLLPESAPMRRLSPNIADSRLLGGLDLAATLQSGRPVAERGILAEADGGVVMLSMAERLEPGVVAKLGAVLDSGTVAIERDGLGLTMQSRFGVIAFDEGVADESPRPALLDRLAFLIDLNAIGPRDLVEDGMTREAIAAARGRRQDIVIGEPLLKALCATATTLGIASLRASLLAVRAAKTIAALRGRDEVLAEDAQLAAQLVLAPRATIIPAPDQPEDQTEDQTEDQPVQADQAEQPESGSSSKNDGMDNNSQDNRPDKPIDDLVLAAAAAAIPAGLLAQLSAQGVDRARSSTSGKAGMLRASRRRGRPTGVRTGAPRDGERLNLIETLRAAAPWQRIRREAASESADAPLILVRRDDFRLPRLRQRSETTTIFVVDASGSSALNRLAEAKGAVELLLAECYVRRDKVALIAFRGKGAELLLPATRSLVRAKRCLANLPGGGGTPLADGIDAAGVLADGVRRQGSTPVVILMTDGRANVARGGAPGRVQAEADAHAAGRAIRAAGLTSVLIDTSARPQPLAARLAAAMGATYLALPSADSAALSRGVEAATARPAGR